MKAQLTNLEKSQPGVEISAEHQLSVVNFHQSKISCSIDPDGQVWVGINPICEAIGIHSNHALVGIKKDPILGSIIRERVLLDAKKRKFPMQCLPIEYIHGWLFSIDSAKVSTTAKSKLLQFKRECYQVLYNHFFGKYRVYEANLAEKRLIEAEINQLAEERAEIQAKITKLKKRMNEITALELSGQFTLNLKGGR